MSFRIFRFTRTLSFCSHKIYINLFIHIILQEQLEEELEEELDEVAKDILGWGSWGDYGGWGDKGSKGSTGPTTGTGPTGTEGPGPVTCPFETFLQAPGFQLTSAERICLILPLGMSQPGTPVGAETDGIFCADAGQYTLRIINISEAAQSGQRLVRVNLDLGNFDQQPPGIVVQALTGVAAPSGETAMIVGGQAPTNINFQGFYHPDEDCSFRVVSTQGGQLIGKFTGGPADELSLEFTQTGQVTSLLSSLAEINDTTGGTGPTNPGRPEFAGAIGTITLDFAFAFKGVFDDGPV